MYEESMQGLHDRLVHKSHRQKLTYIAELIPAARHKSVIRNMAYTANDSLTVEQKRLSYRPNRIILYVS